MSKNKSTDKLQGWKKPIVTPTKPDPQSFGKNKNRFKDKKQTSHEFSDELKKFQEEFKE